MVNFFKEISRNVERVIDYLLPPVCGCCGDTVFEDVGICSLCWKKLTFLSNPCCEACGYPFDLSLGKGAICGECERAPKSFSRCRAALAYNEHSKGMIIGYKHADRTYLTKLFSKWMALSGGGVMETADIIVPVPLHPRRLLTRKYNQSALLAQRLARVHKKLYLPDLVIRTRHTASQGRFSNRGRWRNVRSAFQLNAKYANMYQRERIVIIDDVYTTGATLDACSRALKQGGISNIDALVLARVTKE